VTETALPPSPNPRRRRQPSHTVSASHSSTG